MNRGMFCGPIASSTAWAASGVLADCIAQVATSPAIAPRAASAGLRDSAASAAEVWGENGPVASWSEYIA